VLFVGVSNSVLKFATNWRQSRRDLKMRPVDADYAALSTVKDHLPDFELVIRHYATA
jgi:hypothetical protein